MTDSADPMHVVAAAGAGDAAARELLVERARTTGRAAALLLDVLNPETVVVTEVGVIHFEDCLAALCEAAGKRRSTAVLPTSFPDSVLAVAGGSVVLDALFRDPLSVPSDVL